MVRQLCSSAFGILLLASSPLKLGQLGWGRCTFSGFSRNVLIGLKPRLWLGHSRTFTKLSISHSYCVLWVIVLLEGEPSARLRFWMLWTGFSLRLSQYFGALSSSYTPTSPSVPAVVKQPHSMRLLPAHFTFGMVLCRWRAVPGLLQTWCWEMRFVRPENLVSYSLRVL